MEREEPMLLASALRVYPTVTRFRGPWGRVAGTGRELPSNSRGNTQFPPGGNAYSDARGDGGDARRPLDVLADEDLASVASRWADLSPETRAEIVQLAKREGS